MLDALAAQQCDFSWEIVVVDNESTDDSVDMAKQYGARIVTLPEAEFSYGRAINVGIERARGEIVVLLSAHALPLGRHFLQSCAEPMAKPDVAAAKCHDVHHSPVREWYKPRDLEYRTDQEKQNAIKDREWWTLYPIATCCVVRKSVWNDIRFDELLECSEDKHWASEVLKQGYKIHHCADAMWMRLRRPRGFARWNRLSREGSSAYRITGNRPMTWGKWCVEVAVAIIAAPVRAIRYTINDVVSNTILALSPWMSKGRGSASQVAFVNSTRIADAVFDVGHLWL